MKDTEESVGMSEAEMQGRYMILQSKATDLGKAIRELAREVGGDPTLNYFAGCSMSKLEECMHRVGDMFKRLDQLSPENIEKMQDAAIKSGNVVDMTGKPVG